MLKLLTLLLIAFVGSEFQQALGQNAAFSRTDFKTLTYQTRLRGNVRLRNGKRVYEYPEGGGGDTFDFRGVDYADITGDGVPEAIVRLSVVSCGGSCDGGSNLFYFFEAARRRPNLLFRIETGSAAYGECGLKSFVLERRRLTLELFQRCRYIGPHFRSLPDPKNGGGKFEAQSFTRFTFGLSKRRLGVKKREVLPFYAGSTKGYDVIVSVRN